MLNWNWFDEPSKCKIIYDFIAQFPKHKYTQLNALMFWTQLIKLNITKRKQENVSKFDFQNCIKPLPVNCCIEFIWLPDVLSMKFNYVINFFQLFFIIIVLHVPVACYCVWLTTQFQIYETLFYVVFVHISQSSDW